MQNSIKYEITFKYCFCIYCIDIYWYISPCTEAVPSAVMWPLPLRDPRRAGTCPVQTPLSHPTRMQQLSGDPC